LNRAGGQFIIEKPTVVALVVPRRSHNSFLSAGIEMTTCWDLTVVARRQSTNAVKYEYFIINNINFPNIHLKLSQMQD
jgi:hypothetical protein